ncbi:MAG: hypothetical protein KGY70_16735, partial [Bacteroidales bacterium]|nr:hypothetical protein [Bacteroidales bacterium]
MLTQSITRPITRPITRYITSGYEGSYYGASIVYGIKWDTTNSSSTVTKGVINNGAFVEQDYTDHPIQEQIKRVLRKADASSKKYLDADDSTKLSDGSAATLDGSDGDVQAEIPRHYQLWVRDGDTQYILIGDGRFKFLGVEAWMPLCFRGRRYYYFDAFEGVLYDDDAGSLIDGQDSTPEAADKTNDICRSLPGYKPWVYEERGQYRQLFANRGGETHQQMWNAHQMIVALFVTEYGDWDSQSELPGYTDAGSWDYAKVRKTGRTMSLGNVSGSVQVDFSGDDSDLKPSVAGGGSDWVESTTTPGEYYYDGDLVPTEPVKMLRSGVEMTNGTLGSLNNDEWAWGDQDSIGEDRPYVKVSEGDPDSLSADTIEAQLVSDTQIVANSYRGIENIFGHIWGFLDGINIDNTSGDCHVYTCTTPDDFADDTATNYVDTGHTPAFGDDDGYIVDILGAGKHCPLYPDDITGGSSSTYLCDYHYNNSGAWRVLMVPP